MEWDNPGKPPPPHRFYVVEAKYSRKYDFSDPTKVDLSNPLTKKTGQMSELWRYDRIETLPQKLRMEILATDHGALLSKVDDKGNYLLNKIEDIIDSEVKISELSYE
jgi:hypothetical protein